MENQLFHEYADFLRTVDAATLDREIETPSRLLIDTDTHGRKALTIAYAPFDHMTRCAQIVIVGLTPGRQQMCNALFEARKLLRAGATEAEAMAGAKVHASFSGPMRNNLIAMLDDIGVNRLLGLDTTAELWANSSDLVHFTSALRYPVFVNGENFSGTPNIVRTPVLRRHLDRWFGTEMAALKDAIFVPLGPKADEALRVVAAERQIDPHRVLSGLPHPSGANAERIAFFLGRKPRNELSNKVAPDRILENRAAVVAKTAALGA